MAINKYFNNTPASKTSEQDLLESLLVEAIQISGTTAYYLPRESWADAPDAIYGEDVSSKFASSYAMEMYLGSNEGFYGQEDFFSKFGLEIRDQSNFIVARRTFAKYVPSVVRDRPREGDLIYIPVLRKVFE